MKKVLSLAACSALVLGFAATASAVHVEAPAETSAVVAKGGLVTIDGAVRHRGFSRTHTLAKDKDGSTSGYDTRVRLGVTAQTSDAITGRILLENGSGSGDTNPWGESTITNLFAGGEKKGTLEILEAWIQYQPANYGVKVGHMPLALGKNLFFDHTGSGDDAIVGYINPTDATHVAALTIKFAESFGNRADTIALENLFGADLDGDGGTGTANNIVTGTPGPGQANSLSALGGMDDSDDIDGYVLLATHKISDALKLGGNYTYLHNSAVGMAFQNLGLTLDGKVGGFSYGLDGEFQFGDLIDVPGYTVGVEGMAFQGTAGMDLNGVALGALVGYGTGHDINSTSNDTDAFINFLTDTRYQSTMVGYIHAVPGAFNGGKNSGLSNLTLVQLSAAGKTTCPMTGKDLSLKARANYLQLSEEVVTNGDDDLGFELEGFADWKLGNGLVYGIEAAYLWAGDGWDMTPGNGIDETEDGYYLRHRLELQF
ncbi:MAG: hypothetical protein AB1568_05445 [Thermodesulfobacteriota bacterium]